MIKKCFLVVTLIFSALFCGLKISNKINYLPVKAVEEESYIIKHCASRDFSLLLTSQNKVYGWGSIGDSKIITQSLCYREPVDITKDINLKKDEYICNISAGEQHLMLLSNTGRVFALGSSEKQRFGYSDMKQVFYSIPYDISSLFSFASDEKIIDISSGCNFNVVLTNKSRVITFGDKTNKATLGIEENTKDELTYDITNSIELQIGDKIIDVECTSSSTLLLTQNGVVYSFGTNDQGKLGLGCEESDKVSKPSIIDIDKNKATTIVCGADNCFILTDTNVLYGMGSNDYGQITVGSIVTKNDQNKPIVLNQNFELQSDEKIIDVFAGFDFTIVKTNMGNLYSFGNNESGQLAISSLTSTSKPQKIEYNILSIEKDEIDKISCGKSHCIATSKLGRIFAWGSNSNGQLANKTTSEVIVKEVNEITSVFPPIVNIYQATSSIENKSYILYVDAKYLDKQPINNIYYCTSNSTSVPIEGWSSYDGQITLSNQDGKYYIHLKIDSDKGSTFYTSNSYLLDNTNPTIEIKNEKNEKVLTKYYNSTICVQAKDNNDGVVIVYTLNGKTNTTNLNTISFIENGSYIFYALDCANNKSATIEVTIDTILPTITKIDNNLISGTSYSTSDKEILIQGSEALVCYQLEYNGKKVESYTALNENESSFKIKLKKGENTLKIFDLAGNQSLTYIINYSPRFFQDTQLLLLVFSITTSTFVIIIIIIYIIKHKKKLIK